MLNFLSFIDCPVICHVHELDGVIRTLGTDNLQVFEKRDAKYIAVANVVRNNLITNHGIPTNRIKLIPGFVPSKRIPGFDNPWNIYQKLGISKEAKIVCGCGSVEFRKGSDLFLEVANLVNKASRVSPVHFVWLGGRLNAVKDMQKQVAVSALRDVVHFVGPVSDVMPYFEAADIFLLTSREDPFPLAMLEAALCRTPVICFAEFGGAVEFVEDDAGFAIPGFNVDKMAGKVIELLLSPDLCNRMGLAAREKVMARHDLVLGAAKIAALIEDTLSPRGSRKLAAGR